MEARTKVTKEVLCEESRFILANVMAEGKYGKHNRYDDIKRLCEGAVSIPFTEYVGFLEAAGYLAHDRDAATLSVTDDGERIVNGGNLAELTNAAVSHFKNVRASRRRGGGGGSGSSSSSSSTPEKTEKGEGRKYRSGRYSRGSSTEFLDNRYEKVDSIGSGGVGHVYKARQVALDREVAVKELREIFGFFAEDQHAEIKRRFKDVIRAAGGLAHPNIAPIHDVNFDREYPYVVSELAPNGSARRLIKDAESIPVNLTIKYLLQTLHALAAAHKADVSHRGLKPENMLIDAYGNIKVSDFGFSRIVERDQSVIRQVYVGMGSVAYMAPELFVDPLGAGVQTDIYALGIIFYELLTRKLPGRRSPMPSDIDKKLPKGIDDIFDKMTRDDQEERYSAVEDILTDFDKVAGLGEIVGNQTAVLEATNPLAQVTFKPESEEDKQEASKDKATPPPPPGADDAVLSSAGDKDFSYSKRKKKN